MCFLCDFTDILLFSASLLLDSLLSYLTSGEHKNCKAVYLHVLTTNTVAILFYEKRRFSMHHFLPFYYSIQGTPRDGFSYVLYINGGQPPWTLTYPLNFILIHIYLQEENVNESIILRSLPRLRLWTIFDKLCCYCSKLTSWLFAKIKTKFVKIA